MKNNDLKHIYQVIATKQNIVITAHVFPDGDSVGTAMALAHILRGKGKQVAVIFQDEVPLSYQYLAAGEKTSLTELEFEPQLVICVDCGDFSRIGNALVEAFQQKEIVNLDHHISNTFFGDHNYVDGTAAAAAEVVYQLCLENDLEIPLVAAEAFYSALVTDSGSFLYSSTSEKTLKMASYLLGLGIDIDRIRINLFEMKTRENLKLTQLALEQLKTSQQGRIAWIEIRYEDLCRRHLLQETSEEIVRIPVSMQDTEIGIIFKEIKKGIIKISFRSKYEVDVNRIAQVFGGGGHKKASGCRVEGDFEQVVERVLSITEKNLE